LMHGALRQAAHPQQPLFQFVQVSFEVTFHEPFPLVPSLTKSKAKSRPASALSQNVR
jgi:hypothetical protein